ncbi:MAG: division/cell wall cluster transcriptional repressor MraZ [Acutalibacteraceae bacterium]
MKAFNGTFEHNLDSKNRLFIPAEFKQMLEGRITVRLALSKYPHIDCYKEEDFEDVVAYEIEHPERPYPKDMLDSIARSYAKTVAIDNGGRICVPAKLLEKAGITKESVFVGKGSFFQIWNPQTHEDFNNYLMQKIIADDEAINAENEKRNEYRKAGYFLDIKNTLGADISDK